MRSGGDPGYDPWGKAANELFGPRQMEEPAPRMRQAAPATEDKGWETSGLFGSAPPGIGQPANTQGQAFVNAPTFGGAGTAGPGQGAFLTPANIYGQTGGPRPKAFGEEIFTKGCPAGKFDNTKLPYKAWALRMRSTAVKAHPSWGALLDEITTRSAPIVKTALATSTTGGVSHILLAETLYGFISDFVNDQVLNNLDQITDVGNGFEVWRRFAFDHKGGDRELREDGQMRFLNFPQCSDLQKLSTRLDEWDHLRRNHCLGMPDGQT